MRLPPHGCGLFAFWDGFFCERPVRLVRREVAYLLFFAYAGRTAEKIFAAQNEISLCLSCPRPPRVVENSGKNRVNMLRKSVAMTPFMAGSPEFSPIAVVA